jgi:hypothetical protein
MGAYFLVEILYVDNLIMLANNIIQLKWLKSKFEKAFEINNLKKIHYNLRIEFF